MSGGDRLDDGQAQAKSAGAAGAVRGEALERLESRSIAAAGTCGPVLATVRTA